MVGESGIAKLKMYRYYKCLSAKRKRGCDMKAVKKDLIERVVVNDTVKFVLQDSEIKRIAKELVIKQQKEDYALPMLERQLSETEKGLTNLVNAIQQGILTPTTKQRIDELEATKADIEVKILQAKLQKEFLTEENIIHWISRFKGGDIENKDFQRTIIDLFVNVIYYYDDRIVLTYNYKSNSRTITMAEIEASDLVKCLPPVH
jgi:predicted GNAT family acetyltransferase